MSTINIPPPARPDAPDVSAASTAGCCGGPAPQTASACCARDAEAKAGGGPGCGCGTGTSATPVAAPEGVLSGCC